MDNTLLIGGGILVLGIACSAFVTARILKRRGRTSTSGIAASKLATSLRDEKQKSDIILHSIEDGVMLLDSQKTIQLFNNGASDITGWPSEEAQGLDFHSVIKLVNAHDEAYEDEMNPLAQVYKKGETIRDNNANLMSRSGKRISISLSVTPLIDENNEVTAAVAVFRDVSKERQQEAQRAEFISTASHEMRTPVAAIEGYLSLALNEKVAAIDARARGYLDKAYAATRHLGELFQDLLTSAKAEDGRLSNHPVVVEMGAFLEQLSDDLRFSAEKKKLASEFVIGSGDIINASPALEGGDKVIRPLYYVYADPDRLREVLTNLFDNAVKYTDEGKVILGLTGNNDIVQMYIKDTGHGIPPEDIPHLFQKFYRVDNSATRTVGGTGLGLFICSKIIELYQGRIWVDSKLGAGSTFYINLPRLTTERAQELQAKEVATAVQASGAIS